ncbi:TPA: hypothetical protein AB5D21_003251 [Vibrio cholerae]
MNVLVLTANFAPRGASPAIRTVNLVRHLSDIEDVNVKVVTYDTSTLTAFSVQDESLSKKVPDSVEVIRVKSGFIRRLFFKGNSNKTITTNQKKRKLIKNPLINFLIPDPHIESVYSFYKVVKSLSSRYKPDVIITHAYPFSFHILGYFVKKKFKDSKWVADYGDPWFGRPVAELTVPWWRESIDCKLESLLLAKADLVTLTTLPAVNSYLKQFNYLKGKVSVLPMGYDSDDMTQIKPIELDNKLHEKFLIVHTGRIYPEARNPIPFIDAIDSVVKNHPTLNEMFNVVIVGDVDGYVFEKVKNRPCAKVFTFVDWVPVEQSIAWMKRADLLLLFGNKGDSQIPGKVFQYIGANKPILFSQINPLDPTRTILDNIDDCIVCENEERIILDSLLPLLQGTSKLPENISSDYRDIYSWKYIAGQLYNKIKSL